MSAIYDSSANERRPEFVKMEEEFSFASRHGTEVGDDPVFDELYDYAAKLRTENAKMRGIYDREYLNKLKVSQHEGELITANCELLAENAKLREALKPIMKVKCPRHKCLDQKFNAKEDEIVSGSTTIATEMEYDDGIDGSVLFHYGDAAKYIVECVNSVRKAQSIAKEIEDEREHS